MEKELNCQQFPQLGTLWLKSHQIIVLGRLGSDNPFRSFPGEVAEVILFDEALNQQQIDTLVDYFDIKYGRVKACRMPAPSDIPDGYISSCNTDDEAKSEKACLQQVSCDNGYSDNPELHPLKITCNETGGVFIFSGCFEDTGNEPTNEELAHRIISANALFHFDPNDASTVSTDSDDRVTEIRSLPTKTGDTPKLVRNDTSGPLLEDHNGIKMLRFSNVANEVLKTSGAVLEAGRTKFSIISAFDREDSSTNYEGIFRSVEDWWSATLSSNDSLIFSMFGNYWERQGYAENGTIELNNPNILSFNYDGDSVEAGQSLIEPMEMKLLLRMESILSYAQLTNGH